MAVRDLTAHTTIKDRLWVRIYIFIYIYFWLLYFSIEFLRGSVGVVRIGGPWTGPWGGPWTRSVGLVHGPGVSVFGSPLRECTPISIHRSAPFPHRRPKLTIRKIDRINDLCKRMNDLCKRMTDLCKRDAFKWLRDYLKCAVAFIREGYDETSKPPQKNDEIAQKDNRNQERWVHFLYLIEKKLKFYFVKRFYSTLF